jgi:hypothetical protein
MYTGEFIPGTSQANNDAYAKWDARYGPQAEHDEKYRYAENGPSDWDAKAKMLPGDTQMKAGATSLNSKLLSYGYKLAVAANTAASPAAKPPAQPDIHLPEHWEDNAAFDNRMQGKKDYAKQLSDHAKEISNEAKLQNLDAQAAIAASKARQARQARIVNPNSPTQGSQQ